MKKILIILCAVFICGAAIAQTIRWHIGDTVYQTTTCNAGESITPPPAPEKFGYSFVRYDAYTPIEYLENGIGTYIDTEFIANQDTRVIVDQQTFRCSSQNDSILACAWSAYNSNAFCIRGCGNSKSNYYVSYGNGNVNYSLTDDLKRHTLDLNRNKFYIDGVLQLTFIYRSFYTPYTLRLCQGLSASDVRIFSLQIYDNDVLIRDFIPVLDKNGTPCMYDKVERKFYYNAGTGQFIAGPVIGE